MASDKKEAEKSFDAFIDIYEAKYPKAVECLKKDRDVLLTFYDFPAEHWGLPFSFFMVYVISMNWFQVIVLARNHRI